MEHRPRRGLKSFVWYRTTATRIWSLCGWVWAESIFNWTCTINTGIYQKYVIIWMVVWMTDSPEERRQWRKTGAGSQGTNPGGSLLWVPQWYEGNLLRPAEEEPTLLSAPNFVFFFFFFANFPTVNILHYLSFPSLTFILLTLLSSPSHKLGALKIKYYIILYWVSRNMKRRNISVPSWRLKNAVKMVFC